MQKGGADIALLVAFCLFFLSALGSFIYFSLFGDPPINGDKILEQTMTASSAVKSYTAEIFIQNEGVASSSAVVNGTVRVDTATGAHNGLFSFSLSRNNTNPRLEVETLTFPEASYAKFILNDKMNKSLAAYPPDWVIITASEVGPEQYAVLQRSLAVADVLELFRKGGKYLAIEGTAEKQIGGVEPQIHFVLRPSKIESDRPSEVSENFDTLLRKGEVNVWVAAKDKSVREVRYSVNGYSITMRIKNTSARPNIERPEGSITLTEWKTKQFSAFALKDPISEIFIGSYGAIKKEYLEALSSAIKKQTGIKATVLIPGSELPQTMPLYNAERKQFDADTAYNSAKAASQKYGAKTRFIYVLDVNMYSSLRPKQVSAWFIDELGSNTVLMSLYGLRRISDTDPSPADQPLVISRAQKIALHALGTSVGFGLSPSTENPTCLSYKTDSLAELDKQGTAYCAPESSTTKAFFKK